MKITREELIKKYINFFKNHNHQEIPNASLIPQNDPTVLFTTAGMHPLVPYLLGQPHPLGKRLVNVQQCLRTGDINEVGDNVHLTFFEMLGNWSLGDYFKKEAIELSYEFLTKILKLSPKKLAITCFKGDKNAPKDTEAANLWEKAGISKSRIFFLDKTENWWGPAGNTGPCGPDTEMFYWVGKGKPSKDINHSSWIEIWNDVFMQYVKDEKGRYKSAKQKNVDTGMGVERTIVALSGVKTIYDTYLFKPIIKEIEKISKKSYQKNTREFRIIADHIRSAVFIISDGVRPSNLGQGYVLRRLIRRAVRYAKLLGIKKPFTDRIAEIVIETYRKSYTELSKNKDIIFTALRNEESRFNQTLEKGLKEFKKISSKTKKISGKQAFLLYQSYGFPVEMTTELAKEKGIKVDLKGFEKENKKHQCLSREATQGTFKSGLADNSNMTKKLHTATHLLNAALKAVLKDKKIKQRGSNITSERLRFDFNFPRKLTDEEKRKIEDWVNDKIKRKLKIIKEEMPLNQALKSKAEAEFGAKYPSKVFVYTILDEKGKPISKEICTGPHASNTSELGKFKIKKEQSSAAGIRRIKAVLE